MTGRNQKGVGRGFSLWLRILNPNIYILNKSKIPIFDFLSLAFDFFLSSGGRELEGGGNVMSPSPLRGVYPDLCEILPGVYPE